MAGCGCRHVIVNPRTNAASGRKTKARAMGGRIRIQIVMIRFGFLTGCAASNEPVELRSIQRIW